MFYAVCIVCVLFWFVTCIMWFIPSCLCVSERSLADVNTQFWVFPCSPLLIFWSDFSVLKSSVSVFSDNDSIAITSCLPVMSLIPWTMIIIICVISTAGLFYTLAHDRTLLDTRGWTALFFFGLSGKIEFPSYFYLLRDLQFLSSRVKMSHMILVLMLVLRTIKETVSQMDRTVCMETAVKDSSLKTSGVMQYGVHKMKTAFIAAHSWCKSTSNESS